MRIRVTRSAAAQIEEAAIWWAENRALAPGAIQEELERSFAILAIQPSLGARARNKRLAGVRRIHLSRIHYYLLSRVGGCGRRPRVLAHQPRHRTEAALMLAPNKLLETTRETHAPQQ